MTGGQSVFLNELNETTKRRNVTTLPVKTYFNGSYYCSHTHVDILIRRLLPGSTLCLISTVHTLTRGALSAPSELSAPPTRGQTGTPAGCTMHPICTARADPVRQSHAPRGAQSWG